MAPPQGKKGCHTRDTSTPLTEAAAQTCEHDHVQDYIRVVEALSSYRVIWMTDTLADRLAACRTGG